MWKEDKRRLFNDRNGINIIIILHKHQSNSFDFSFGLKSGIENRTAQKCNQLNKYFLDQGASVLETYNLRVVNQINISQMS